MADQAGTSAPTEMWEKILKLEEKVKKDLQALKENEKKQLEKQKEDELAKVQNRESPETEEEVEKLTKKMEDTKISAPYSFSDDKKHEAYLKKYMNSPKKVLLLGMEPGEEAQQTGVPFGDPETVRDWMKLNKDLQLKSNNKVLSGKRLCSVLMDKFATAEQFFKNCGILNACPLVVLDENKEKKMDNLKTAEFEICEKFVHEVVDLLKPKVVICFGNFPYNCARALILKNILVIYHKHPSPKPYNTKEKWVQETKVEFEWFKKNFGRTLRDILELDLESTPNRESS